MKSLLNFPDVTDATIFSSFLLNEKYISYLFKSSIIYF